MKKLNLIFLLTVALAAVAKAQIKGNKPSNFANWVIESNVKTPKNATVKFYNSRQELIYQEEVAGVKLNVKSRNVVEKLNAILTRLVTEGNEAISANLVTAKLHKK
ncbi:hypothetical protein [Pedobacter sp.]